MSKPHGENRISKLLRRRADQPTQISRPDAKKTSRSKLRGSGHDSATSAAACPRPVAGGTRDEKALSEAWLGRTHTHVRHHLGGCVQ